MRVKQIAYKILGRNTIPGAKRILNKFRTGKKDIVCSLPMKSISLGYHTACGYYDWNPQQGDILLCYTADKNMSAADIYVYNLLNDKEIKLATTNVVNWQQGSRLRYIDLNAFIYNDYMDNSYCSIEVTERGSKQHRYPIYDVHSGVGVSLDFNRLGHLRPGYGYTKKPLVSIKKDDVALFVFSLQNDEVLYEVTFEKIIECIGKEVDLQKCYINHVSFSPSGTKFMFFFVEIEAKRHMCYLCIYENGTIRCIERERSSSHYTWKDDNTLLITSYDTQHRCGYYIYDLQNESVVALMPDKLNCDGHPTYVDDNLILSDTYPDKAGYQKILLICTDDQTVKTIAEIYSTALHIGVERCDLHPRYLKVANKVCVDADVHGKRKIYIVGMESVR